jgi:phosphoglycolate phosphatase-like HAD superfamily hydrolase
MQTFENYLTAHFALATVSNPIAEIEGAAQAIAWLQQNKNYAVAFATGSLTGPAVLKLTQAGISFIPELLVTANELQTRDEIVLTACRNAAAYYGQLPFRRTISVGDGMWDMKTAIANGLEFVGIGTTRFANAAGLGLVIDDFTGTAFFDYL